MRYAQIRKTDISNGEGIGVSIFTQGCPIHCPGCHNSSIWDFEGGHRFTQKTIKTIKELVRPSHIKRFSVLGGEPMLARNLDDLAELLQQVKSVRPGIKIWVWTGYTFEELMKMYDGSEVFWRLMSYVSVLVDGCFVQEKKDLGLKWRGSSNQRVIDMRKTMESPTLEPVLYCE